MKAILEFNLPEENYQHKAALQGPDLRLIIGTLDNALRGYLKYGHEFKNADDAIETIRKNLHEDLESYNINLYDE